jgi:oxygen-independent coproporphyrinogen-3 oxidase
MNGLYLHIPFCEKKCVYCDFYSLETTYLIDAFVDTLLAEIALRADFVSPSARAFDTVFFGGGTPSLLSPKQLERIAGALRATFSIAADAEWTMECNPGTVSEESLRAYRAFGVNRLSFGVQSFFEDDLRFLSRIHSNSEANEAVRSSRKAGFDNVNIDLMFALPDQSFERWRRNLETAVSLETDHISAYSLIFEPGTPLKAMLDRGEVRRQDEEREAAMYEWAMEFLRARGYEQYEVSNYARDGKVCRHNCLYWQGDEYLAFGPSAHGYIANKGEKERYWNIRSLAGYTRQIAEGKLPIASSEILSAQERMFERAFLELRARGIRKREFFHDFGVSIDEALKELIARYGEEFLLNSEERLALSSKGYLVCDAITLDAITALERFCGVQWRQADIADEAGIIPS